MNKVLLQGQIVNIYKQEFFTAITLAIPNGSVINYPSIYFYKNEKEMADSYKKNDYVNITGQIKVRGVKNGDKWYMKQYIKGSLIYLVKNEMSEKFLCNLNGRYEYINEFLINGPIVKKEITNDVITIAIRPHNEKFNIYLRSYSKNHSWYDEYKENDELCIKGLVQTLRRNNQYGVQYYQNFIIEYSGIPASPEIDDPYNILGLA